MRKSLLLLLCFIMPYIAIAQYGTYLYLKPLSFVASYPLGSFAKKGTGSDIPGKVAMGYGVEGYSQRVITKGFMAGLGYRVVDHGQDETVTDNWLRQQYTLPGFYTEISNDRRTITVSSIYIQVGKRFSISQLSIIPFVQAGLGFFRNEHSIFIHQKKANENYWKDTRLYDTPATSPTSQTFFYPRFGFNAGTRLYGVIHLVGGMSYGFGRVNNKMRIQTADFDEKGSEVNTEYQHSVSELSAVIGVEFRFDRKNEY